MEIITSGKRRIAKSAGYPILEVGPYYSQDMPTGISIRSEGGPWATASAADIVELLDEVDEVEQRQEGERHEGHRTQHVGVQQSAHGRQGHGRS